MRKIVLLALCLILFSGLNAEFDQMQRLAANAAAQYLDVLCMDTLFMLQQIADSPEARSADWDRIYPKLETLSRRLPGVYFFVLPDGNYYSVEKGLTNLNLKNRPYFESLFQGNPVKGFEIYSRSSGQKSALMAAPILANDKVVGALGSSLFLDDLHAKINRDLMVPPGYTWFVVNHEGLVMLDQEKDYIFMNLLTESNESVTRAISAALKSSHGEIEYSLGKTSRKGVFTKLPTLNWRLILVQRDQMESSDTADISLASFSPELQQYLRNMDGYIQNIIREHQGNWSKEADIRPSLALMLEQQMMIIDAAFVDEAGIVRYIEPGEYRNHEGADISAQSHVQKLRKDKKPVFSKGFTSVEGITAVSIAYPVYNSKKKFMGSVSLLVSPRLLVEALLNNINIPASHELCIMQKDGFMIYDQDEHEIGKNLFTDPMYQDYDSLLKLGEKIAKEPSGTGDYVFQALGHQEKVMKKADWITVRLHDQEWRVVIAEKL